MRRLSSARVQKIFLIATFTLTVVWPSFAQKSASGKFNDAVKRSAVAAETVAKLSLLPEQQTIPRALIARAEAIGLFRCEKIDLLLEHSIVCPGAISRRLQSGWSLPAYFRFIGGGFGRPNSALADLPVVIVLFNDDEALSLLTKHGELKNERQAVAGPVGLISSDEIERFHQAHIIAYAINAKGLWGRNLKEDSWLKMMGFGHDKINERLYRHKGTEVLAGAVLTPPRCLQALAISRKRSKNIGQPVDFSKAIFAASQQEFIHVCPKQL